MKFSFVAVAAILSTGAHAQTCSVCSNGITVAPETQTVGGNTCDNIANEAAKYGADDETCGRIKFYESVCCPANAASTTVAPSSDTCSVCSNGITVAPETPTVGGNICENIATEAAQHGSDDAMCGRIKVYESVCCPANAASTTVAPSSDTCSVCSNGITVAPETPTVGGNICENIAAEAAQHGSDDAMCGQIKVYESVCCPDGATTVAATSTLTASTTAASSTTAAATSSTAAAVASSTTAAAVSTDAAGSSTTAGTEAASSTAASGSCVVCDGVITAPADVPTVEGKFCRDLLTDAAQQNDGDGICELIKLSEATCCPPGGFVACSICAEGLIASGATFVVGDTTCDDMMTSAATTPAASNMCTQMKNAEEICCPTGTSTTMSTTTAAAAATSTTTAAAAATSTAVAEANSSTSAAVTSSTVAATTEAASTTAAFVSTKAPSNENLAASAFNTAYDTAAGFSVSAKLGFTSALAFVLSSVYVIFS